MSDEKPTSIWQRLQARPALLVGGGAGVVALIIAVVLVIVLAGGGGDSEELVSGDTTGSPTPTATASNAPTATPTPSGPLPEVTDVAPELDFFGELAAVHSHPVTATFDSAADSLSLADGATVEVPAGAFPVATELSVAIIDLLFENYLTNPPEARIYVLSTEDDIVLGAPLVLEVPKPSDSVNVIRLVDGEWLPVDVPAGPTTRIEIAHFSDNTIAVSDKPSGEPELKTEVAVPIGLPMGTAGGGFVAKCTRTVLNFFNSANFVTVQVAVSACSQALAESGFLDQGNEISLDCIEGQMEDEGRTFEQATFDCTLALGQADDPDPQPEPESDADPDPETPEPPEEEEPSAPEGFLTLLDLSAVLDDCKERSSGNLQCFYTLSATLQYETPGLPSSISCDFGSIADSEGADLTEVSGTVTLTEGYIETLVGGTVFQDGNPIVVKCRLFDNSAPDGDSFTVGRIEEELTLPPP